MKIYGWIIFGLVCLGALATISDSDMKAGVRIFGVLGSVSIATYILLTLI